MHHYPSDIAFTPAVKDIQTAKGSRASYAKVERRGWRTHVTPDLAEFLAGLDMFYLGTASAEGQPYIQHRGGIPGFLKVLDDRTLALRRLRRQPPVHHVGKPVREPESVHLPDGLRQPAAGQAVGHRQGGRG